MVFVTHNLPLVRSIAQKVAVLADGNIVEYGETAEILANPQQEYTRHLISDTPSLEIGDQRGPGSAEQPTRAERARAHRVTASDRPDILIVIADQLTTAAMPFHGNEVTRAPAMAELAEQGVVFDNAYTASPLCTPARASMMTGLLPSNTHSYDNAAGFSSEIPTFAHHLRSEGYRTVLAGKMHFCGPDQLHGFEERLTTDIYPADYDWTPDWDSDSSGRTGTTTCPR